MITYVLTYTQNRNQANGVYFPLFMMGNSIQSLLFSVLRSTTNGISSMGTYTNAEMKLRWIGGNSSLTFLGGNLTDPAIQGIMTSGQYLNLQSNGVELSSFNQYYLLYSNYKVLATFQTSSSSNNEWIAIM